MSDDNEKVEQIEKEVIGLGKKIMSNPVSYLVGVIAFSLLTFGVDKTMEDSEKMVSGISMLFCGGSIELTELRVEKKKDKEMFAYRLSQETSSGKILKVDCDSDKKQIVESFSMAISATADVVLNCQSSLDKCVIGKEGENGNTETGPTRARSNEVTE
jgi:hypothetical protein